MAELPEALADFLAAVQLRVQNVRECPSDAPDAMWRSIHSRSARDVPWLTAAVDAGLRRAAEWEEAATEMNAQAERCHEADLPVPAASFSAGAEAYAACARELREAIAEVVAPAVGVDRA